MTCDDAEILLHALIDGELDASHAREVEAHIETCPRCTAELAAYRKMHEAMAKADLRYTAPASLRQRIDAALPKPAATASNVTPLASRRSVLRGFALGSAVSALAATLLVAVVVRHDDQQMIESEIVSAHLRSLQPNHLIDVVSTDQHTVKPWFNGKLDFSPPVSDLATSGYPLIGGRLDYLRGRPVAALVYQHRKHFINVFLWPNEGVADSETPPRTQQGYHVVHETHGGMAYWIVSDLNPEELSAFARLLVTGG
jgi:anti-sigma factor RsiW